VRLPPPFTTVAAHATRLIVEKTLSPLTPISPETGQRGMSTLGRVWGRLARMHLAGPFAPYAFSGAVRPVCI